MRRGLYRKPWQRVDCDPPAAVENHPCPGCTWPFPTAEALATHIERCDLAWTARAEQMKRAALEAQAKGNTDEYEANMRRAEDCATKARAARAKKGAT